jgi:hypothetical protein
MTEDYFSEPYVESRHRYVAELRGLLAEGLPKPKDDWDAIYVFSGPEIKLEDAPHEKGPFNQTKVRLETGIDVAKQVTALRLKKNYDDVTADDIRSHGPSVYFDGYTAHNQYFGNETANHRLEKEYGFPDDKFIYPKEEEGTKHTGEQIERFPDEILKDSRKFVIISDLYHMPRIQRYLGSKYDVKKIPEDRAIFYYAKPTKLPVRATLREAKKIRPLKEGGHLSKD